MVDSASPQTEELHPQALGLDQQSDAHILSILLSGQMQALEAMHSCLPDIAQGAALMSEAIQAGARIHYVAAGSSGLMSLADCAEIPGTFGISPDHLSLVMAGGVPSSGNMPGKTEDDAQTALEQAQPVQPSDVVIAMSASGNTPYPVTFAAEAKRKGARIIAIANNGQARLFENADVAVHLNTPSEVIAGSTRLGAGTAQKVALNMMSSLMGIRLGHVMDGMMINVVADNEKLLKRATGIVEKLAMVPADHAQSCLKEARGSVKIATLLAAGAKDVAAAKQVLEQENENLRTALSRL